MRSAAELLKAHLHYLTSDFDTWKSLFAPEAIMEYPYGTAAGVESSLYGIAAITKSVAGFMNAVTNFRAATPKIHQIQGEDAIIAEFTADADVVKTGRKYHQNYAVYLRASEGKIVLLREYFDPTRVVASFVP
jgi:ketosteroid isomerase-like protein